MVRWRRCDGGEGRKGGVEGKMIQRSVRKLTIACSFLFVIALPVHAQTGGPGAGLKLCGAPNALCVMKYGACTWSQLRTAAWWRRYRYQATCVCADCGCV